MAINTFQEEWAWIKVLHSIQELSHTCSTSYQVTKCTFLWLRAFHQMYIYVYAHGNKVTCMLNNTGNTNPWILASDFINATQYKSHSTWKWSELRIQVLKMYYELCKEQMHNDCLYISFVVRHFMTQKKCTCFKHILLVNTKGLGVAKLRHKPSPKEMHLGIAAAVCVFGRLNRYTIPTVF